MNSRERVIRAINHQEPDRVPVSLGGTAHKISDPLYFKLRETLGIRVEPQLVLTGISFTYYDDQLLDALGTDTRYVHMSAPQPYKRRIHPDGSYDNEWGITFRDEGHYQGVVGNPLRGATVDAIPSYPWPDPNDPCRVAGLADRARRLSEHTDAAIVAYRPTPSGLFETASMLRGMEQFMVDLMLDKEFASVLLDTILDLHIGFYRAQLEAVGPFVQMVEVLDDYGTQAGLMISPALYREMFLPRHQRLTAFIHDLAPQAKIMFHSCGGVAPLIPDFVTAGFDVLNPMQPRAAGMDFPKIKLQIGKDMAFLGGLDVQQTMRGAENCIVEEIQQCMRTLAPGGGYVFAPSHNLSHDVPLENVFTMIRAAKMCGQYPIQV